MDSTGDGFWDRQVAVPTDDAAGGALRTLQPADGALLVPSQLQQPAASAESAAQPTGSSNDLARLFAGMKVAPPAPAPVAAPPAAALPPTMLLTPQLLQQEAAGAAGEPEAAAEAAAPGTALLQSLLRGSQRLQQQPALPVPVDITGGWESLGRRYGCIPDGVSASAQVHVAPEPARWR